MKKSSNVEIVNDLIEKIYEEWKYLRKCQDEGKTHNVNLDYEQGKDRKAAIVLKAAISEIQRDKLGQRKLENSKLIKVAESN